MCGPNSGTTDVGGIPRLLSSLQEFDDYSPESGDVVRSLLMVVCKYRRGNEKRRMYFNLLAITKDSLF